MTLIRQLILTIVTLFILLFAGTFAISVHNTQAYLSEQLKTISQDTATSLGLTLSPHFAAKEMVIVDSMVSAIFDSGYYREVTIRAIDGKPIVERQAPVHIDTVPAWFVRLFPLDTPRGEALIMAGWQQAGTLSVAANPGQAYVTLWANSVESFWWFLCASIVTFLLGVLMLHFVLRPLRAVEAQAKAICDRQYPVQTRIPWTIELRSVVEAMNRMTTKVKEMFDEQAETMERIRSENFRDPVSGLANRRFFDQQLRHLIAAKDRFLTGALILFEIKDLKRLNEQEGFARVDALLEGTGKLIQEQCVRLSGIEHFAAHIAGADFAVVLADITERDAEDFAEQLMHALPRLQDTGLINTADIGHAGLAMYRGQSLAEFLAEADTALRAAQTKGANAWQMHRPAGSESRPPRSASQWSEVLRRILDEKRIVLFAQTVRQAGTDQTHHHEILLRLIDDDGSVLPAGVFIPMAKRLGLVHEFDRLVVRAVMAQLGNGNRPAEPIAINLFPTSIGDAAFVDWLIGELTAAPQIAAQLIFEISEYGAVENLDALRSWVNRLRTTGARSSIDHFGKGFTSFGYLCDTRIDCLKIDGSYIADIEQNKDDRFFVESVMKIAHGLDMTVIAESVESDKAAEILTTLGIDGLQGYAISEPKPWPAR
jgi:diguanylate cyclase (GGDEF)-like protein